MPSVGKTGIDYFPYDVDLSKDPKIEYIEALHGLLGYAIYLKLLEKIYCNGYYTNWSERDIVIFAKHNTIDKDVCILIVNDCINEGLFDKKLYNDYKILTSSSIQKRYLKACERRKQINLTKEFLLLTESWINAYIKNVNVNILSLNVDILPHIETDIETDLERLVGINHSGFDIKIRQEASGFRNVWSGVAKLRDGRTHTPSN